VRALTCACAIPWCRGGLGFAHPLLPALPMQLCGVRELGVCLPWHHAIWCAHDGGRAQVVVEAGAISAWLFTSAKSGEVMRKRAVDDPAFLVESFCKAALADPRNSDGVVCIAWPAAVSGGAAGPPRLLRASEFEELARNLPGNLPSVCALQGYQQPRGAEAGSLLVVSLSVSVDEATGAPRVSCTSQTHLRQLCSDPEPIGRHTVVRCTEPRVAEEAEGLAQTIGRFLEVCPS
jgi:hypothetical protein